MKKFFDKDQTTFAIVFIVIYVVGSSILGGVSESIGMPYATEAVFNIVLAAVIFIFAKKNGLTEYFGLKKPEVSAAKMLFYIPLIIIPLRMVFFGLGAEQSIVFRTVMMLFVGFNEEMIFRAMLFKGIAQSNVKQAIIISSLTFGIGHIVNLLNGYDIGESLGQIAYAVAVGFMLVMVYVRTDSIIPCVVFHSLNNMTTGFTTGSAFASQQQEFIVSLISGLVLAGAYLAYTVKFVPKREIRTKV